jgi:hypothetical protein
VSPINRDLRFASTGVGKQEIGKWEEQKVRKEEGQEIGIRN